MTKLGASRGTSNLDVHVLGLNFATGAKVKLGKGISVTSSRFVSPSEVDALISISSRARIGARSVMVTNQSHGRGHLAEAFTVK